jgi:hypothetical protein
MHPILSTTLGLALFLPAVEPDRAATLKIAIAGGKYDLAWVPMRVPVTVPGLGGMVLRDGSGKELPCQLTTPGLAELVGDKLRELHFVLPQIKAGETLELTATFQTTAHVSNTGFSRFQKSDEYNELRYQDRPVLRYMHQPFDSSSKEKRDLTYKVYHHLFDPAGEKPVTKGPGGLFPHHRGLFYGFNRIGYGDGKKADVWHCTGDAYQDHEKFLAEETGPVLGRQRVQIGWHGPGKEVFAREVRELTVYKLPGGILVEFASRLGTTVGPVKLDGDPQHAGFQFRADNEVAAKTAKQTYYIRPDGVGQPGQTRNWPEVKTHVNLPWYAMNFVLGGTRYTAAYLDRPENPKEARFSERDYGRFGSYFAYELTAKNPLIIRYRLWLQEGAMTPAEVAARAAAFIDPPRVTIK